MLLHKTEVQIMCAMYKIDLVISFACKHKEKSCKLVTS